MHLNWQKKAKNTRFQKFILNILMNQRQKKAIMKPKFWNN